MGRLALWFSIYLVVFAAACVLFELLLVDDVANWIADTTSSWISVSADQWENFVANDRLGDNLGTWQVIVQDDGSYKVRDLEVYYALRSMKVPAAVILCLAGYAVIVMVVLNRSLRYFDELSGAVGKLVARTDEPVELSGDLSIVQGELNAVREQVRADERAALAAEQRKNEMVAYLAHDIKTPLTSVLGYLSLLCESDELPEQARRKYAEIAFGKAERLEGLIDEFFEITRYNLQAIPIERATVDAGLFCQQVAESFEPTAQARDIAIEVDAPAGETFFVDADKLARALGNVMRNAVSYADSGSVIYLAARRDEAVGSWIITVTNHGREISPAHLQSIFEKFYREDASRSTHSGGSGLGLAIAREIMIAHGGGIRAASCNGETTFTLAIPLVR